MRTLTSTDGQRWAIHTFKSIRAAAQASSHLAQHGVASSIGPAGEPGTYAVICAYAHRNLLAETEVSLERRMDEGPTPRWLRENPG